MELCSISTSTAVPNHRASFPSSARVLGEHTATIPVSRTHATAEEARESRLVFTPPTPEPPLPLLERSACFGAIGQPINPEWKTYGAAVVKGIRSTCLRCGQAGLRSP
ncbi:hypothetical protein CesoFtcFv8_008009 [Champsocephalus esox]|uniref:Uncharacterized protein n=2 Tax=Channichthyidae TaxID=30806 RepID=A0AAN8H7V2_9TELE|nr:hypothetical protein KUCAC02_020943 [Chaenocephalus aceratus]KAK5902784.1 hypothetical protein CesoFtcFv8_008009 [Champsocephalus esox]